MKIKLKKGEIHLIDALSRRQKYEMENRESELIKVDAFKEEASLDTKKAIALKEYKVLLVIDKIVINEKELPVEMDTLLDEGNMTDEEFKKVFTEALKHANSLAFKSTPTKKS